MQPYDEHKIYTHKKKKIIQTVIWKTVKTMMIIAVQILILYFVIRFLYEKIRIFDVNKNVYLSA
jgi:hypothetical protein